MYRPKSSQVLTGARPQNSLHLTRKIICQQDCLHQVPINSLVVSGNTVFTTTLDIKGSQVKSKLFAYKSDAFDQNVANKKIITPHHLVLGTSGWLLLE